MDSHYSSYFVRLANRQSKRQSIVLINSNQKHYKSYKWTLEQLQNDDIQNSSHLNPRNKSLTKKPRPIIRLIV